MNQARTITIHAVRNGFAVHEGERHSGQLSWDEMLGQVASMTLPRERHSNTDGLFGMRTPDEWDEQRARWRRGWVPTGTGLGEMARQALNDFAREFGARGGQFDELLPIDQQPDERVRCAMRLLELSKEPAHA